MSAALDSATAVEIRALQLAQGAVTPQALLDAAAEFAVQSLAPHHPVFWSRRVFAVHPCMPYALRLELRADLSLGVIHARTGQPLVYSRPGRMHELAWAPSLSAEELTPHAVAAQAISTP